MVQNAPLGRKLIAPPGYPWIIGSGAAGSLAWLLGWSLLAWMGFLGAVFFLFFFRDPERAIPADDAAIVAPADGKVIIVDEVADEDLGPARRVAVFMNVFDVHVNRSPAAASVVASEHHRGRFLLAFREDADKANERQVTVLATGDGRRLKVVQIAGLVARRIICPLKPGDRLERGQRIGMICFGSRVDLYLPPNCSIMVKVGDRVKAGASIVGKWE